MRKLAKHSDHDLVQACHSLARAAESFVNRAPRLKRLEAEREALFDALSHAQLVLSVNQIPRKTDEGPSQRGRILQETKEAKSQWKHSQSELAKSRHVLEQLEGLLNPVTVSLDELQDKAKQAQTIVKTALNFPARILPFRNLR